MFEMKSVKKDIKLRNTRIKKKFVFNSTYPLHTFPNFNEK